MAELFGDDPRRSAGVWPGRLRLITMTVWAPSRAIVPRCPAGSARSCTG
jgi:hypothetical protein